jgi:hypothetical protein
MVDNIAGMMDKIPESISIFRIFEWRWAIPLAK